MGGGGEMQGGVAHVDVVAIRDEEVGTGILPGCADQKRLGGDARCLIENSRDYDVVSGGDRSEERKQLTFIDSIGFPTWLRHENRLPDLDRGRSWADPAQIDDSHSHTEFRGRCVSDRLASRHHLPDKI